MSAIISSKEDKSSILEEGRAKKVAFGQYPPMIENGWKARLEEALEQSGRSKRSVSLAAGLGPGYVHSILKEGKDPTIENLIAVANALNVSLSYLLYGYDVSKEAEEILSLLEKRPHQRSAILQILRDQATN